MDVVAMGLINIIVSIVRLPFVVAFYLITAVVYLFFGVLYQSGGGDLRKFRKAFFFRNKIADNFFFFIDYC